LHSLKKAVEANPEKEIILFSDASHFNQSFQPNKIWQKIGSKNNRAFFSKKHAKRTSVMGSIDPLSGRLFSMTTEGSVNKVFFSGYLDYLVKENPYKKIYLVLDNAKYQNNNEIIEKAKMLGIILVFLPTYCPNLNLIERLWKFMKKEIVKQKNFLIISDLNLLISEFIRNFVEGLFEDKIKKLFNFNFQIL